MRIEKSGRSRAVTAVILAVAAVVALPRIAAAETTLRIGMTAADIPRTLGQPDQGFEGNRFTGLTMYDALTMWDLSSAEKPSVMIPGLAADWKVDDSDHKKWTFKLRPGVKFHDGSDFNADAVVWNVEKVLNKHPVSKRVDRAPPGNSDETLIEKVALQAGISPYAEPGTGSRI